ncbi:MAG: hypothetical protein M1826_007042 [Phylliscum demangeonii]|nr:MAG: hypothetical protein M1826_007042 [Phylliscum demangeonii]
MSSNLDLVNACNGFQPDIPLRASSNPRPPSYCYLVNATGDLLGYLTREVAQRIDDEMDAVSTFVSRRVHEPEHVYYTINGLSVAQRTTNANGLAQALRARHTFKVLDGWRDEQYAVYSGGGHGARGRTLEFTVERAMTALLGVATYGVHMTLFVRGAGAGADADDSETLQIWVPRRKHSKQTYAGMLDNSVAGGIAFGETPWESLVREAHEEASLPAALVQARARPCGVISYIMLRGADAGGARGGEQGLVQPECEYVYDMEVGPDVIPAPNDDEVEEYRLWSVPQVQVAMRQGQFKPNCALVLLDFFFRHGILTAENEHDYLQIVQGLHRSLDLPVPVPIPVPAPVPVPVTLPEPEHASS